MLPPIISANQAYVILKGLIDSQPRGVHQPFETGTVIEGDLTLDEWPLEEEREEHPFTGLEIILDGVHIKGSLTLVGRNTTIGTISLIDTTVEEDILIQNIHLETGLIVNNMAFGGVLEIAELYTPLIRCNQNQKDRLRDAAPTTPLVYEGDGGFPRPETRAS